MFMASHNRPAFQAVDEVDNDFNRVSGEPLKRCRTGMDVPRKYGVASKKRMGLTVWFTGLSSAGKTTICQALREKLGAEGYSVEWLDGDVVRESLSKGLGFSKEDRNENVRRIGYVAELLTRNGVIVLVSAISPYATIRNELRQRIGNFLEVFVHAPLSVCQQRDVKGIYRRARSGEIRNVTGMDDPYEAPTAPEVECRTDREQLAESTEKVLRAVEQWLEESN
jgi:adenylylsulfate kinase